MKKLMLATVIGALAGFGAALHFAPLTIAHAQGKAEAYAGLNLFGDILALVRGAYVEEVDDGALVESGIRGMLTSLDPHSSYLPPDGYEDMQEQTEGQFGGLGIEVTMEDGFVKVVAPIDDTPAARAGMKAGDFVTHLDGESILGLTLNEAVERMRGLVDTDITLTVVREGADEPFDVTITRAIITVYPVRARREGDVAYLRVTQFNKQTSDNLTDRLEELKAEIGEDKLRGYVIDLRNNPGGLLRQAIKVSDIFLQTGEIVSTRGRDPRDAERHNATEGDLTDGAPIVVLINGGSASASEIVAGALQDHRRAVLVGTRSFGKGSVQTIMPLNSGGAIRLTTARYYTPSGRSIQALGIDPDIVVDQLEVAQPENQRGLGRTEDSLRGRLDNDTVEGEEPEAADDAEEIAVDDTEQSDSDRREKLRLSDYQLAYALDLLAGVSAFERLRQ